MDGLAKMAKSFEPFSELYKKGIAVGSPDIKTDTVTFRFKDELFEIPTIDAHPLSEWNGYFVEADIKKLRKWKNKK